MALTTEGSLLTWGGTLGKKLGNVPDEYVNSAD